MSTPQPIYTDRSRYLLKACYDMLKHIKDQPYVTSPFETTVHYDGADCDGTCLMEDIAIELGLKETA